MLAHFPPQFTPFVGRAHALQDIRERLMNPDCRLLTITGAGGSGKTRLAIEVAKGAVDPFPSGSVFVGLQSLASSSLLVPTVAHALGLSFYGSEDPQTQLFGYLREKSLLLLLDNFEHLLDGATFVSHLLDHSSGTKIIVTSREMLNLQEEWLYPLSGMETPLSVYSTSFETYEAVQLFLYHARRIQPSFNLNEQEEPVMRICKVADGLPLAIELAASWLKSLSPAQIAAEMQKNLDFLSTTVRNVEERHRSIRAAFDQSWKLLSANERRVFARLSVFRGSFDREAAEQVAGASLSLLVALVEKSLLQTELRDRFKLHDLLRQYSVEKLDEFGETDVIYARHSAYFAEQMLQHEAALRQPSQFETMRAIEMDFENIRLAWNWALQHQQVVNLDMMLHGLYLFGFIRSHYRETITIFQHTLEQPLSDPVFVGRLLVRRWGYLHWWYESDYGEALIAIQQALSTATAENNTFEAAFCHLMAAYAMIGMRRYADAIPHLEQSKSLFEAIHESYYVCWVLHRLGYAYSNLGNSEKTIAYTEQSLALARVTHNRLSLVICLYNLGSQYMMNGDYVKGRRYCEEALQVATEAEHQGQIAHSLSLIALCAFFQGEYETCQELAERSQSIIEDINMLLFQAYNVAFLIVLACLRDDYEEGVRLYDLALNDFTNKMGYQLLYWAFAALACGLGNRAEAEIYIAKVLERSNRDQGRAAIVWVIPLAAYVLAEQDRAHAVELLSWVWTDPQSDLTWVRHWSLFDRLTVELQEALGADAYQEHWEQGKLLTFQTIERQLRHTFSASVEKVPEVAAGQHLTTRESEILRLLATGLTNQQIAQQLVIGVGTVKTHTLSIYRKLDVANRTQAIVRAQELELLPA
jgi:predicted ATPase/DNA-binding CsgD family transcriptional regulator